MSEGIGNVNRLVPGLIERVDVSSPEKGAPDKKAEGSFTEVFSNMINQVNELQKEAAQIQEAFMSGEPVELHQVMIKAQEAGIAMDLLLEVRNKLVDAYNELMRMPL
ncbi:MAG: flagellar hook-basal body complex protein FliE [Candidatus Zixiibacteriota bacterium]|nr:MAG: flagellar hook-basal body complex protein FliE [candidate division Zixibacteria bacterium]